MSDLINPILSRSAQTRSSRLPSLFDYQDYRRFLADVLSERSQVNSKYSLRAFARDIGIGASWLSEILNEKRNLSARSAVKVAERLNLGEEEQLYFCDLVQVCDSRSSSTKRIAQIRLLKYQMKKGSRFSPIDLDVFRVISDWYHFAICELTYVEGFKDDPAWIAKALGISQSEAKTAIDRLLRLGLVEYREGKLCKTSEQISSSYDVPVDSVRKNHVQILKKAISALEEQPIAERGYASITMAIDPARIKETKQKITDFRRELCQFMTSGDSKEVYCFSSQLFRLSEVGSNIDETIH